MGDVGRRVVAVKEARTLADLEAALAPADDQAVVVRAVGQLRWPHAQPLLLPFLGHADPGTRAAAAVAVLSADPRQAAGALRSLLGDDDPRVVAAAASALGVVATPADTDALLAVADHADREVRHNVAEALGHTGDPAALPALAALLADKDLLVRREARRALRRCCLPGAEDALARNPRRSPLGRWREARGARRSRRVFEAAPRFAVSERDRLRAGSIETALGAAATVALAAGLGLSHPWVGAAAFAVALPVLLLVIGFSSFSEPAMSTRRHDRARALDEPPPDGLRRVGWAELLLRRLLSGRALLGTLRLAALPLGLEALLPTGGALAGTAAALLTAMAIALARGARQLGPDAARSLGRTTGAGDTVRGLWREPPGPPGVLA